MPETDGIDFYCDDEMIIHFKPEGIQRVKVIPIGDKIDCKNIDCKICDYLECDYKKWVR